MERFPRTPRYGAGEGPARPKTRSTIDRGASAQIADGNNLGSSTLPPVITW